MCGIAGLWAYSGECSQHKISLKEMSLALEHRGPDHGGYWSDEKHNLHLSHRRLSILDLSMAGNQPMISHNDRFVISFNGEIYNNLDLKKELEKMCLKSCTFYTQKTKIASNLQNLVPKCRRGAPQSASFSTLKRFRALPPVVGSLLGMSWERGRAGQSPFCLSPGCASSLRHFSPERRFLRSAYAMGAR